MLLESFIVLIIYLINDIRNYYIQTFMLREKNHFHFNLELSQNYFNNIIQVSFSVIVELAYRKCHAYADWKAFNASQVKYLLQRLCLSILSIRITLCLLQLTIQYLNFGFTIASINIMLYILISGVHFEMHRYMK